MNWKTPFAIVVFIALLVVLYFTLFGSEKSKILEINFVSDHPISSEGSYLPVEISTFCQVIELDDQNTSYIPKISFKRTDLNKETDTVFYSKRITKSLGIDEAKELFKDETSNLRSTSNMYSVNGDLSNSFDDDKNGVRHFYLVKENGDNRERFTDVNMLYNFIQNELNEDRLILDNQKPNTISIFVFDDKSKQNENDSNNEQKKQDTNIKDKADDNSRQTEDNKEDDRKKIEIQNNPTSYNANLKSNGNDFSWSSKLTNNASSLRIEFVCLGNKIVSEDVTGQNSFHFSHSNSNYEFEKTKVTLIAIFDDDSKVTGNTLTVDDLECH